MNDGAVAPGAQPTDLAAQSRMAEALRRGLEAASGEPAQLLETHISFVLLTGRYAYKIKKAVDLTFLDFRTLPSRRYYCEEELRLNHRFAPELYLEVVPVTGTMEAPVLGGSGPAIDYAVKMREFAQDALASRLLRRNAITPAFVDELALRVAKVHGAARVDAGGGDPRVVLRYALRNFERLRVVLGDPSDVAAMDALEAWTRREHDAIAPLQDERRKRGRVRECHGDLHLGNIAQVGGHPLIFDCIEFSEDLRTIDVMSDVAFLDMDFRDRGRPDLANRFRNAYLEATGDYEGLRVLRFYVVYRAMVRAMVACERARQMGPGVAADGALAESREYLALAQACAAEREPAIVVTHGFSGCGKTVSSMGLVQRVGAIRIRTDVERKRLHNLGPTERDPAGLASSMYSDDVTRWVYLRTQALTRGIVGAGYAVIVDGAFLKRWQRRLFHDLAAELGVPFAIVSFDVPQATLRARIAARMAHGRDASDADLSVLDVQLSSHDPLDCEDKLSAVRMDNDSSLAAAQSPERWGGVVERLACQRGEGVAASARRAG
jgi:aminoglycoside phosphotransferase family enzyme/predicted kinase